MIEIRIRIDDSSAYTIQFESEYDANEFLSTVNGHIAKIKRLMPEHQDFRDRNRGFKKNILFENLALLIEKLGGDITYKDKASMRAYTSIVKNTGKEMGLAWLQPVGRFLHIYLRKGNHHSTDPKNIIMYSTSQKKTFGGYPLIKTDQLTDIGYISQIIRGIYEEK
jgi:hypothetical protein